MTNMSCNSVTQIYWGGGLGHDHGSWVLLNNQPISVNNMKYVEGFFC